MLYPHMLNSVCLPEPPRVGKKYFISELSNKEFIDYYINFSLDNFHVEKLCDKTTGKFPDRVTTDFYGTTKDTKKSRSIMPSKPFMSYIMEFFDITALNDEQVSWVKEAVKNKLKSISMACKKAEKQRQREIAKADGIKPKIKRVYKKKRFSEMTEAERAQARFERAQKMYENALKREKERQQNNQDVIM